MKQIFYNGKTHFYNPDNYPPAFTMEIGRYNNSYKIVKQFHLHEDAIEYYESYRVENGYKKRLKLNGETIAFQLSKRVDNEKNN